MKKPKIMNKNEQKQRKVNLFALLLKIYVV